MKPIIQFVFHLVTPLILGKTVGKLSTKSAPRQYKKLKQPPFAPPRKIFAPMWTFLYLTMGLAHALVKRKGDRGASRLFKVHLMINYTWSFLFFRLRKRQLALVNSIMIWVTMYAVLVKFFKVSRLAGHHSAAVHTMDHIRSLSDTRQLVSEPREIIEDGSGM